RISLAPPGATGTITRIGLEGYAAGSACADATGVIKSSAPKRVLEKSVLDMSAPDMSALGIASNSEKLMLVSRAFYGQAVFPEGRGRPIRLEPARSAGREDI